MRFKGWVKSTLLDYPGHIAASLFCGGCNFRCPNCHNRELVLDPQHQPDIEPEALWDFLNKRRSLLDGVAISGGEPTLQPDLISFSARLHEMGYRVKLDTNGYRPAVLEAMLQAGAVDYVAMDVKAPLAKYALAAGVPVDGQRMQRSIDLLRSGEVEYEFRTTVVPGLLDEGDILEIARWIAGARHYAVQQFVPRNTLDPAMLDVVPYLPEQIQAMADLARPWAAEVSVRGL